jgi:hypothetical protein
MNEELKGQIDNITKSIDAKIEKSNVEVVNSIKVKASEIVKSEVAEITTKFNEQTL